MKAITLHAEQGSKGLWYVSSPDVAGLLIAASTLNEALSYVEEGIEMLGKASTDAWIAARPNCRDAVSCIRHGKRCMYHGCPHGRASGYSEDERDPRDDHNKFR